MPTYLYRCPKCQDTSSVTCPISEYNPALPCAKCETAQTRIYDSPGVTFKSPGFYTTDKGQN